MRWRIGLAQPCFRIAAAPGIAAATACAAHRIDPARAASAIGDARLGLTGAGGFVAAFSAGTRAATRATHRIQTAEPAATIGHASCLALTDCVIALLTGRARAATHAAHRVQPTRPAAAIGRALTCLHGCQCLRGGFGVPAGFTRQGTSRKNEAREEQGATKNAGDAHEGSSRVCVFEKDVTAVGEDGDRPFRSRGSTPPFGKVHFR